MQYNGIVHKYGDNVNTDVIIPARHCNTIDPHKLAGHCLEDLDTDFVKRVKQGDILVGGFNFGCGSSREVAPIAIKYVGIDCVIAKTFARIFYRNAINIGLPIVESPEFVNEVSAGDRVSVHFTEGKLINITRGKEYHFAKNTGVIQEIIQIGGLVNHVKQELKSLPS
ncbi:MAG: 3-isopropylmalate dehydratase small subunit [bacterium]|nr:3-isopropylmalate dehydratase small subunit [bacterium]